MYWTLLDGCGIKHRLNYSATIVITTALADIIQWHAFSGHNASLFGRNTPNVSEICIWFAQNNSSSLFFNPALSNKVRKYYIQTENYSSSPPPLFPTNDELVMCKPHTFPHNASGIRFAFRVPYYSVAASTPTFILIPFPVPFPTYYHPSDNPPIIRFILVPSHALPKYAATM